MMQDAEAEFVVFGDCIWGDRKDVSKVSQRRFPDFRFFFVTLKIFLF